jgi:ABC-type dipeptide/oligopeptide/nickel transport system permease component
MSFWRWLGWRVVGFVPMMVLVSIIVFGMVRLLPGNPAYRLAGLGASAETIKRIEAELGLNKPLALQYWQYVGRVARGDLGHSSYTHQPVSDELAQRLPATVELLTVSFVIAVVLGVSIGVFLAVVRRGRTAQLTEKVFNIYGLLAGAIPEFWLGLILIYVFFFKLNWLPGPIGRVDLYVGRPEHVTGLYLVDSILTGDWSGFRSVVAHLVLPVATLAFLVMAPVIRMTRASVLQALDSEFVRHARRCGLHESTVARYALRAALAPIVTVIALLYSYLLGGAVLVEKVFAWGGLGQYAVQAVVVSDYAPLQAFVLLAAIVSLVTFLVVDVLYALIDPRVRL